MFQALAGAFPRHFHQTQGGHLGNLCLDMVLVEALLQGAQYLALVFPVRHIDKVDNDNAAEVTQSQLPGNGLRRLQIGLENGLFKVAMTDITTGVYIRGSHGLCLVNDQVTA